MNPDTAGKAAGTGPPCALNLVPPNNYNVRTYRAHSPMLNTDASVYHYDR
jgi:hypothetical protein